MSVSPPAVPKPATAGPGKTAIITTTAAYVNLRTGPGTNYRDIGDIFNKSTVVYYPGSRTSSGWVWLEQNNQAGWVSTSVARFEDIVSPAPQPNPTPYDNRVAVWHWKGDVVPEDTIDNLARNIRQTAPNVTQIFVKTSDYTARSGARWQGFWDTKRALAVAAPESIDRWVDTLARYGLEFHAWCVPRGLDERAETDLIIQACQRPGVKSMILDVEPYEGFWSGGRTGIAPFMNRIRREVPASFHIGIAVDPRPQHYSTIFPPEWFPFINSVHTMSYWATFRRSPDEVLAETYRVWGGFGRTIIPILQGDAQTNDMKTAHTLATQRHGAPGLSWWRLGVIGASQWTAVNLPIKADGGTGPGPGDGGYGEELVIRPDDNGFAKGSYTGKPEFLSFQGTWGWTVYYTTTGRQSSKVWAQWSPRLGASSKYEVSAFVPARHATTRNARYKIHGVAGNLGEVVVPVDQSQYSNQWVTLGVFDFDRSAVNAGSVFLNDLTFEDNLSISFDAIRWRQIIEGGAGVPKADGYDSPVGTDAERRGTKVWPGNWYDASPFGRLYFIGTPSEAYHTGADLNLPQDNDRFAPVYAVASGVVVFASRLPVWGNVIIIKHDPLKSNGKVMYSRTAHVDTIRVNVGQRVSRGEQIATVGNAFGQWAYHLHFDLSPTTILETQPQHWPGKNLQALLSNYIDPRVFIEQNRP